MKKNFISYIFIIFLLTSFSIFAEREIDFEKLEIDEKTQIAYVIGEKEAFTGIAKEYYEDKTLKSEYSYKNGKLEGRGKDYYPNAKLKYDAFYKDGIFHGESVGYFEDGKLQIEIPYKNGQIDGFVKEYYENGQVHIQESYKNDELDGESLNFYENGNLKGREVYDNGVLIEGGIGSVVAGDVPDSNSKNFAQTNENIESKLKYYTTISAICTVIGGLIIYAIFKIFKAFPKTSHLTDEQRSRIFKILMKYDEHKEGLFSAYRMNGVGTAYYRVRSMMVDNEKMYIYAKMFSFLYIPTPITFGYLLCYNKDKILASFSNATFKEVKKEIQETVLYL